VILCACFDLNNPISLQQSLIILFIYSFKLCKYKIGKFPFSNLIKCVMSIFTSGIYCHVLHLCVSCIMYYGQKHVLFYSIFRTRSLPSYLVLVSAAWWSSQLERPTGCVPTASWVQQKSEKYSIASVRHFLSRCVNYKMSIVMLNSILWHECFYLFHSGWVEQHLSLIEKDKSVFTSNWTTPIQALNKPTYARLYSFKFYHLPLNFLGLTRKIGQTCGYKRLSRRGLVRSEFWR